MTRQAENGNSPVGCGGSSPPRLFDRKGLRLHRRRAVAGFKAHDFLFREIADRIDERLSEINRSFTRALVLGNHGGIAANMVAARTAPDLLVQTDLAADLASSGATPGPGLAVAADEEALPFAPQAFNLAVSVLGLHWVNDLPGTLLQIRRSLGPDGLMLAAMMGGDSLHELRHALIEAESAVEGGASPRVSPFVDVRTAGGLLQRAGFALPMVDTDSFTVTYENAFALMKDLRGMGEANALLDRRTTFTRRRTLLATAEAYHARHAGDDGRIPVTFDILYLTAWAPHESQPRPLTPGTAKASLTDMLGRKDDS
ncbi:MAG: methyltransferase domain-containing protein [Sphingomonadales bacterium]